MAVRSTGGLTMPAVPAAPVRAKIRPSQMEPGKDTDNALLLQAGSGDREAFARLYDRLSGPLYSLALQMLNNDAQEAEDALMEGMTYLWTKAPTFDPARSAAFTWCVMLFRSRVLDRLRKRALRTRTLEQAIDATGSVPAALPDSGDSLILKEQCEMVQRAVASLPAEQAELLRQAFFKGKTHHELAEQTGKPLGTVKTLIRRALIELRGLLRKEGYEP